MKKIPLIFLSACLSLTATQTNAQTLINIGNNKVSKEDFLKIYQKNAINGKVDYSDKAVNEYLDLYTLFRMKVAEANEMHLDTFHNVQLEIENYRNQLAQSYLTDKSTNEKLMKQAYERSKEEVEVAHILIATPPNKDEKLALKTIDSLYQLIATNKATFEDLAVQFSDDKPSAKNGGNIGYITVLETDYIFEDAAYNTPVGKYSKPFKTNYGYHIVKVKNKRKSAGQVQVQQIMVQLTPTSGEQGKKAADAKLAKIQADLKAGKDFNTVVALYSDDKYSKNNNGLLEPFGTGQKAASIENAAFALKKVGDISEPVQTDYGYHIFKLVKKIPVGTYEETKESLGRQIETDARSAEAKKKAFEDLKKQIGYKEYPAELVKITEAVSTNPSLAQKFEVAEFPNFTATLFEVNGKKYSQKDYITYVSELTRGRVQGSNPTKTLNDLYEMYTNKIVKDVQMDNLYKTNAEYRALLSEYMDGILLFDLMERNVWNKASSDTAGLNTYYANNKAKYVWKPSFEGKVFQSGNPEEMNELYNRVNKGEAIMDVYNDMSSRREKPAKISMQEGRFELFKFNTTPDQFVAEKPTKPFLNSTSYTVVFPSKVIAVEEVKSLGDARGFVVADYQDYLEKEWNASLKKKYPVKVDEKVLSTIIKK